MPRHCMADLETWDILPTADIRSIGAAMFDPTTGELGADFYINVRTPWYMIRRWWWPFGKLTRSRSTVKWWSEQSAEAQAALETDQVPLHQALQMFGIWWHANAGEEGRFWAMGPHFDEVILAHCYRAAGIDVPWHYRAPRDVRTVMEATGLEPRRDIPRVGIAHNALDDAKAQALGVMRAFRRLEARSVVELEAV